MALYRILLPEGGAPLVYEGAMSAIRRAHLSVPLRDPFRYGPSRADAIESELRAGRRVEWSDNLRTVSIIPGAAA